MKEVIKDIIFKDEDFEEYKEWVCLNLTDVTWQGKYEQEFEEFWKIFFLDGSSFSKIIERFEFAKVHVKVGPLYSWFNWLRDKFICYVFVFKGHSLYDLSHYSNLSVSEISFILRNFFITKFPHLEDYFGEKFQVSGPICDNLYLKFTEILNETSIDSNFNGSSENEILSSLEVTLYPEWNKFFKELRTELLDKGFNVKKLKERASVSNQKNFLKETVFLFLIGIVSIYLVNYVNIWYEKELSKKINIFELDFFWLDKSLKFRERVSDNKDVALNLKELEALENAEGKKDDFEVEEERFTPESEVILTSVSSLPKDFSSAGLEQSDYEELRKGGYRDNKRSGNRKVYRVLMKSVDPESAIEGLNTVLTKYDAKPLGNVKPGTKVPGGVYYNLYVPRIHLKEFLTNVMEISEATLYENRSRGFNPPG